MEPGMYGTATKKLINSKYSVDHEPSIRSAPVSGPGYSPSGNNRGGYSMGPTDAGYSKNMSKNYGRGLGGGSAGTEGNSKKKY